MMRSLFSRHTASVAHRYSLNLHYLRYQLPLASSYDYVAEEVLPFYSTESTDLLYHVEAGAVFLLNGALSTPPRFITGTADGWDRIDEVLSVIQEKGLQLIMRLRK